MKQFKVNNDGVIISAIGVATKIVNRESDCQFYIVAPDIESINLICKDDGFELDTTKVADCQLAFLLEDVIAGRVN